MVKKEIVVGRCWPHYHDEYLVPGCCHECSDCGEHIKNGWMAAHRREHHPLPRVSAPRQQVRYVLSQLKRAS